MWPLRLWTLLANDGPCIMATHCVALRNHSTLLSSISTARTLASAQSPAVLMHFSKDAVIRKSSSDCLAFEGRTHTWNVSCGERKRSEIRSASGERRWCIHSEYGIETFPAPDPANETLTEFINFSPHLTQLPSYSMPLRIFATFDLKSKYAKISKCN